MEFTFTGELVPNHNKLWAQHVVIPEDITTELLSRKNKRVWSSLFDEEPFQCAITPVGNGVYVIKVNKALMKKHALELGSKVVVGLDEDKSKHGLPFPEALKAVIDEFEDGHDIFFKLSEGKRRTLLYIVGQCKNESDQINQALVIMQHLQQRKSKIDYKELHKELRDMGKL